VNKGDQPLNRDILPLDSLRNNYDESADAILPLSKQLQINKKNISRNHSQFVPSQGLPR
jgi:hypothetical protein